MSSLGESRTCPRCGAGYAKANGRQVYCSDACRLRAKEARKARARRAAEARWASPAAATERECPVCLERYAGRGRQVYCSPLCKSRAAGAKRKQSPAYAAELERRRARYVPAPPRPVRLCEEPGCGERHFALGLCRAHYRQRTWAAEVVAERAPAFEVEALVDLGARFYLGPVVVLPVSPSRVFAWCPECRAMLSCRSVGDRFCGLCGLVVSLDVEELLERSAA